MHRNLQHCTWGTECEVGKEGCKTNKKEAGKKVVRKFFLGMSSCGTNSSTAPFFDTQTAPRAILVSTEANFSSQKWDLRLSRVRTIDVIVFLNVTPYSLVGTYRLLGEAS